MPDPQNPTPPDLAIPVRSKRQAMDWSLVLASQGIAATIHKTETGWALTVDRGEVGKAAAILRQYQIENRGWGWRHEWPDAGVIFHWGAVLWVLAIVVIYYLSAERYPGLKSAGIVDSEAVVKGAWWRLFTAVSLHENLPHLLSNAATGFVLLGLAMARFGPGIAMLTAYLAGVAGNCIAIGFGAQHYYSLGASGMVTGALGLITVQTFAPWRPYRSTAPVLPRAIAGGVLLLVLIGFSPGTDVSAHVGGFVAGVIAGLALGWIRPGTLQKTLPNVLAGVVLSAVVAVTWLLAMR